MPDFLAFCKDTLNIIEQDMQSNFSIERDITVLDRSLPMLAAYHNNSPKPFLFFAKSVVGSSCHEYCYFDFAQTLDSAALSDYFDFFLKTHDYMVNPSERDHEFTFVSFIIFTEELSKDLQKQIKKFSLERKYKPPQSGWSSVRVAVIDSKNKKIYTNSMGSTLKDRLLVSLKKCGF